MATPKKAPAKAEETKPTIGTGKLAKLVPQKNWIRDRIVAICTCISNHTEMDRAEDVHAAWLDELNHHIEAIQDHDYCD